MPEEPESIAAQQVRLSETKADPTRGRKTGERAWGLAL